MADRNRLRTIRLVLWGLVLILASWVLWTATRRAEPNDRPASNYAASVGGPFALIDTKGATVTDADLRGQPFALFFGYTRCPDVCPTTLAKLARWKKALGPGGKQLRIVFVSLDPDHDSPADIGRYLDLFGVPITGLTGSTAQLAKVVRAYHVYYEKVPAKGGDFTIDHTATVFLMDKDGKLASTIDMAESDSAALAKLDALIS